MNSSKTLAEAPFAASAGIQSPAIAEQDPYRALDELMVVVEALCPEWPPRPLFKDGGRMLL
ncbi:MAG: hypothetical protein IPJ28_00035 [Betaproteobacteria bacterium]|nr:hypothetical protein [Betaproteobacteria bacterium]